MNEDRQVKADVPVLNRQGFFYHWGPQAVVDWALLSWMLRYTKHVVPHTFLPVLKLMAENPDTLDADYQNLQAKLETVSRLDSPRERWRKAYANFVDELEWALAELQKYFSRAEYEAFVLQTVGDAIEDWIGFLKPKLVVLNRLDIAAEHSAWVNRVGLVAARQLFNALNLAGFLVEDVEIAELDVAKGYLRMEVPDCALLRATRKQPLPEESCVMACKGACERVFGRGNSPVRMAFEPHLPETSCTLQMFWRESSGALERSGPVTPGDTS